MSMNRDDEVGLLPERRDPRIAGEGRIANEASSAEVAAQSSSISPALPTQRFSPRSSNGLRQSVELHIEELVLHGFNPANRYAIGEAIERELTRLFTEQGAPSAITHDGEIEHVDRGALHIDPDSNPEVIGARVARAIYGGISR
jgi:hypothetical protein